MKLVTPETKTSLLLNKTHQAFAFCTARAAFRHLITGRVKGMDAVSNIESWDGLDDSFPPVKSSMCWKDVTMTYYPDQPYLRSAPNAITGEETVHPIPTIVICTRHFGFHPKRGDSVSLRTLYNMYKGVCQYCLQKIPYSISTKDHSMPKVLGGSNHDFNLVLACKKCNNEKDQTFPYYDINGNLVKPKLMLPTNVIVPDQADIRPEWKPYLYMT